MGLKSPVDHGLSPKQTPNAQSDIATDTLSQDDESTEAQYPMSEMKKGPIMISGYVLPTESPESLYNVITNLNQQEILPKSMNNLGLHLENGLLGRMTVPLHPFQIMGIAWLRHQEEHKGGGMLADEMGLGKTLQALGTVCSDPDIHPGKKTLIVVPSSLRDQWAQEIETKTDGTLKVLIWHGPERRKKMEEFKAANIVIVSYETLRSDWKDPKAKSKEKTTPVSELLGELLTEGPIVVQDSPLFTSSWHRIILDEAQVIRTRSTLTSRAVLNLKATFKILLSGTPIVNSLADLSPMCNMFNVRPLHDAFSFDLRITSLEKRHPQLAALSLRKYLIQEYILRRKKTSTLNGKELLKLPSKQIMTHELSFTPEERRLYDGVKWGDSMELNAFYLKGTVPKEVSHPFTLWLRWRQCCVHPYMIQELASAEQMLERPRSGVELKEPNWHLMMSEADVCDLCDKPISGSGTIILGQGPCGHGFCDLCIRKFRVIVCPICSTPPKSMPQNPLEETRSLFERIPQPFLPSTKMAFMMELLTSWRDDPKLADDKTIIISQFTSALDLAAIYLAENGFTFVKYRGGTSGTERSDNVNTFMTDDETKIMLLSMKAGGLGLNLTRANRVILLEPGWNVAVEDQAFSRCHRIGQRKPVFVHRLVVKDTVEEVMLQYQERKATLADAALDETGR